MNSDKIKNLVKEESAKLAADGGAFGFVRCLLFLSLFSRSLPYASLGPRGYAVLLVYTDRQGYLAALDRCLARRRKGAVLFRSRPVRTDCVLARQGMERTAGKRCEASDAQALSLLAN